MAAEDIATTQLTEFSEAFKNLELEILNCEAQLLVVDEAEKACIVDKLEQLDKKYDFMLKLLIRALPQHALGILPPGHPLLEEAAKSPVMTAEERNSLFYRKTVIEQPKIDEEGIIDISALKGTPDKFVDEYTTPLLTGVLNTPVGEKEGQPISTMFEFKSVLSPHIKLSSAPSAENDEQCLKAIMTIPKLFLNRSLAHFTQKLSRLDNTSTYQEPKWESKDQSIVPVLSLFTRHTFFEQPNITERYVAYNVYSVAGIHPDIIRYLYAVHTYFLYDKPSNKNKEAKEYIDSLREHSEYAKFKSLVVPTPPLTFYTDIFTARILKGTNSAILTLNEANYPELLVHGIRQIVCVAIFPTQITNLLPEKTSSIKYAPKHIENMKELKMTQPEYQFMVLSKSIIEETSKRASEFFDHQMKQIAASLTRQHKKLKRALKGDFFNGEIPSKATTEESEIQAAAKLQLVLHDLTTKYNEIVGENAGTLLKPTPEIPVCESESTLPMAAVSESIFKTLRAAITTKIAEHKPEDTVVYTDKHEAFIDTASIVPDVAPEPTFKASSINHFEVIPQQSQMILYPVEYKQIVSKMNSECKTLIIQRPIALGFNLDWSRQILQASFPVTNILNGHYELSERSQALIENLVNTNTLLPMIHLLVMFEPRLWSNSMFKTWMNMMQYECDLHTLSWQPSNIEYLGATESLVLLIQEDHWQVVQLNTTHDMLAEKCAKLLSAFKIDTSNLEDVIKNARVIPEFVEAHKSISTEAASRTLKTIPDIDKLKEFKYKPEDIEVTVIVFPMGLCAEKDPMDCEFQLKDRKKYELDKLNRPPPKTELEWQQRMSDDAKQLEHLSLPTVLYCLDQVPSSLKGEQCFVKIHFISENQVFILRPYTLQQIETFGFYLGHTIATDLGTPLMQAENSNYLYKLLGFETVKQARAQNIGQPLMSSSALVPIETSIINYQSVNDCVDAANQRALYEVTQSMEHRIDSVFAKPYVEKHHILTKEEHDNFIKEIQPNDDLHVQSRIHESEILKEIGNHANKDDIITEDVLNPFRINPVMFYKCLNK